MKCFKYSNRPKAYITVKLLEEPYGEETEKVVSVGCTLKGDMQNPSWKVHVPLDLAESVGQELIRLVRLEREKAAKPPLKSALHTRPYPLESCVTRTLEDAPKSHTVEDVKALSDAAVSQGRVIKRARKQE